MRRKSQNKGFVATHTALSSWIELVRKPIYGTKIIDSIQQHDQNEKKAGLKGNRKPHESGRSGLWSTSWWKTVLPGAAELQQRSGELSFFGY